MEPQFSFMRVDLKMRYPEVMDSNQGLLEKGIPVLFLAVKKERKGHVREFSEKLAKG